MSNLQADPTVGPEGGPVEVLEGATVALGGPRGMAVTRTLPNRRRRMVGAWCFLDAYGPDDLAGTAGMRVGPHPHIGLQTVSWLVQGEVLHRDSLGNLREVRPGQLNLMTAGAGISHSEETPRAHSGVLQGVQLWVALPDKARTGPPAFAHHADLPVLTTGGLHATVIMGSLGDTTSPARTFSPLTGAEITADAGAAGVVPLRADFEYAVLTLDGAALIDGQELKPGPLLYVGEGRTSLRIAAGPATRVLLLGGEPFAESLVMWWNFVARSHEEIEAARAAWESGTHFGEVHGYDGPALPAPPMPITRLVPRGRIR